MNIFKKFYRRREVKLLRGLNHVLESKIFNLLDEAELLLGQNPEKGVQLLSEADTFYCIRGYNFEVECRINDVCFFYLREY